MTSSRLSRVLCLAAAAAFAGLFAASQAEAQTQTPIKQAAQAKVAKSAPAAMHKVAIQVNQNDKAVMDLALNNARNIIDYYKEKEETVAIEIVTYGPGLHMLRADTSPVKDRIAPMSLENSNLEVHRLRQHPGQPEQGGRQARLADQRGQGRCRPAWCA